MNPIALRALVVVVLVCLACSSRKYGPLPEPQPLGASKAGPDATLDPAPTVDGSARSPVDAATAKPHESTITVLRGGRLPGGTQVNVWYSGATITRVDATPVATDVNTDLIDVTGKYLVPAFIDSHVHLAYLNVADRLPVGGITAVVDLAAPIAAFDVLYGQLTVLRSGPMITAVRGYPTTSWGSGGYGIECGDSAAVRAAVLDLSPRAVSVIKVALNNSGGLSRELAQTAVDAAHAQGLPVAAHALETEAADLAGSVGVDILAHTPTQPMSEVAVAQFATRTVISTLSAFGGGQAAKQNLQRLQAAGTRVLYGTDLGNSSDPSIQRAELSALLAAGLTPEQIVASGTRTPAAFWGLSPLGELAPDKEASILVLSEDPSVNVLTLSEPEIVIQRGARLK